MFHLVHGLLAVMVIQASSIQSETRPIRFSLPSFFAWKPTFPPNPFVPQTPDQSQASTDALVKGLNQFKQRLSSRLAALESLDKELSAIPDQANAAAAESKNILDAAIDAFLKSAADKSQKCAKAIEPNVVGLKISLNLNVCKREAAYENIRRDVREHVTRMKGLSTKIDGLVTTLRDCGSRCGKATLAEVEEFLKHADADLPDVEARKLLVDALVRSQECVARKAASVLAQLDGYKSTFDACVAARWTPDVRTLIHQLDAVNANADNGLQTVQEYTTTLDNVSNGFNSLVKNAMEKVDKERDEIMSQLKVTGTSKTSCHYIQEDKIKHVKINTDECPKTPLINVIRDQVITIEQQLKTDSDVAQRMSKDLQSCGSECEPGVVSGVDPILRDAKAHLSVLDSLGPWVTFVDASKDCITKQKDRLLQQLADYKTEYDAC